MDGSSIPMYWRRMSAHYRLIGSRCPECKEIYFPPRTYCPHCSSENENEYPLSRKGRIIAATQIHVAPTGFELQVPYVMAIIELEEGVCLTSQVVGINPEAITPGMRVKATFRRLGSGSANSVLKYGYKFVPDEFPSDISTKKTL